MKSSTPEIKQLPILPLPSPVLPGGRVALRISEQKYMRMVKESFSNGLGFGVVMLNSSVNTGELERIKSLGTAVEIIDFYSLDDGFLGITVEGKHCFRILEINTESDGLNRASVEFLPGWPTKPVSDDEQVLAKKLQDIFEQYPQLNEMYEDKEFNNMAWLCQRWLEILPMPVEQKQFLIGQQSCSETQQLLNKMIK